MSVRNYNQSSRRLIIGVSLAFVTLFIFLGLIFVEFSLIFILIVPLLILMIIGILIIKFSWNPQNYCSRCNYPVSIYAEFCRNCGLQLISRCPNCDAYVREGVRICPTCGYSFEKKELISEPIEYKVVEKGSPLPLKPNFCPTCGASLKNAENVRFCEYCGSRIK